MSFLESLFSVSGKTAIVTGASRGIGRAGAIALAGAGASVVLVGRDEAALLETEQAILAQQKSARILRFGIDVKDPSKMMEIVTAALQRFGTIDIFVNNAGVIRRAPAVDYSAHDWYEVIDTNLNAVFSWAQAVGKVMIEQGSGKIINMASLLSFQGGVNVAAYTASKGAVMQLTKELSNEWAKYGVQVNAIAPGYIETNATAALRSDSKRKEQILSRIPAGRWGEPNDLQGTILYLASPASDYVTGTVLVVDGGWLAY